jgi:hypothetical protein
MEDHVHYKHPSMLVHNMNIEDTRQEDSHHDHHRASLSEDTHPAVPASTDKNKLYKKPIQLATTPPSHRKTGTHDMSIPMTNQSFSPTMTTATLKRHRSIKMDKHRDSHMECLTNVYMKRITYDVPGSTSHTKGLLRHLPVKFGNCHKTSTLQDQLKMVEYEVPHQVLLEEHL